MIGVKKINQIQAELAYLFNALEHNDESEHSEKIDRAITLLHEVSTDLLCHCSITMPHNNKCEKCGKKLFINYFGDQK